MNELLEKALEYSKIDLSIIPVGKDKRPLVEWKEFQTRRATEEEIGQWWKQWPEANIGIVTGGISGIVVVDIEKDGKTEGWPPTAMAKTGGGGFHFYYKHPGKLVPNATRVKELTDVRGDGGYVVAPPSMHSSGVRYEWLTTPEDVGLTDLPEDLLQSQVLETKHQWKESFEGVSEGSRNSAAASLAGKLLFAIDPDLWKIVAWPAFKEWNQRNRPPLPERELQNVFESILNKEMERRLVGTKDRSRPQPLSVAELLSMETAKLPFLVEKLVPENGITAFSGYPESGKSWVLLHIAHCVATGRPFLNRFSVKQGGVLIVDEEAGSAEFKKRMEMLNFDSQDGVYLYAQEGFKVDRPEDLNHLVETTKNLGVKLIIFDPFSAIHSKTENSAEEMQKVMEALQQFNLAGIAVIFIHHHRKEHFMSKNPSASMGLRGSTVLFARVDCHVAVKKDRETEEGFEITIEHIKLRRGKKEKPFQVALCIDDTQRRATFEYRGEVKEDIIKKDEAKRQIRGWLKEHHQLSTPEIKAMAREAGTVGKSNVEAALKEMVADDEMVIFDIAGRGNTKFYKFTEEQIDTEEIDPKSLFENITS